MNEWTRLITVNRDYFPHAKNEIKCRFLKFHQEIVWQMNNNIQWFFFFFLNNLKEFILSGHGPVWKAENLNLNCVFFVCFFFTFSLNELWLLPWVEVGPGFDHLAHMRLRKFCFWSYWKEFPILLPGFIPQVLVLASWAGLWKGEGVRRMWSLFGERLPKPPLWRFCPFSAYVGTLRWHG